MTHNDPVVSIKPCKMWKWKNIRWDYCSVLHRNVSSRVASSSATSWQERRQQEIGNATFIRRTIDNWFLSDSDMVEVVMLLIMLLNPTIGTRLTTIHCCSPWIYQAKRSKIGLVRMLVPFIHYNDKNNVPSFYIFHVAEYVDIQGRIKGLYQWHITYEYMQYSTK